MAKVVFMLLLVAALAGSAWAAGPGEGVSTPRIDPSPVKHAAVPTTSDAATPPSEVIADGSYIIGPGDVLEISAWKDDALTNSVIVLPDGTISYPLLGILLAAGKTVAQFKSELEKKISEYVPDPVLHLEVKQIGSMTIYVIGRVNAPGRFGINTNINVLQALAMSGGLNPFAKRDRIKVFRQEGGSTRIFTFHYDDIADGKHLEENIQLKRGDVIVVP